MLYAEYYLPTYWNRQYQLPSFFQDLFCIESSAPKAKGSTGFDDRSALLLPSFQMRTNGTLAIAEKSSSHPSVIAY